MAAGFNNQLAVVFGGGRDIGGAIAVELAKRGAQVALSYGSSDPAKVLAEIETTGQKAFAQKVDAMDTAAIRSFVAAAAKDAGKPIGVLVNVVGGLLARKKMDEMDDAFWDHIFQLNVRSVFAATQARL
jgi:3-oxoacyl-[acyl-carrier protein] reductase